MRPFAQGDQNIVAFHVGQIKVEQDKIGLECDAKFHGLFAGFAFFDAESGFRKNDFQHFFCLGLAVDHQKSIFLFAHGGIFLAGKVTGVVNYSSLGQDIA